MVRELEDNVCQHNLFVIGNKWIVVVGFKDLYSSFYDVEGRTTYDLVLHDENARYDSPNRWLGYRYVRLFRLPFKVKYKWVGSDNTLKVRPEVWLRFKRDKN